MVQVGFEPKVAFLCPLCSKEVEIVYEKGKDDWVSEHSGCLNFSVIRTLPRIADVSMKGPLIFIAVESDFSIKEAIEGLRTLSREEADQPKRQKLEAGMKRLDSKLGSAERDLPVLMDAVKSGAYGLRVISGRGVSGLLWRHGERYLGVAEDRSPVYGGGEDMIVATESREEALKFALHWLRYWELQRMVP